MDKIVSCLTLRFTATPNEVRATLPATMEQWAKLRILPGGDTIQTAEMENHGEDTCDATCVRVCTIASLLLISVHFLHTVLTNKFSILA